MLNDQPRQQLQHIISHYGRSVCDDTKRCEALLRDFCPEHKRELNLLIAVLKEGIPQQLLKPTPHIAIDFTVKRLAQNLHENLGTVEHFAFWAVESWALALNVIQLPNKSKSVTDIDPASVWQQPKSVKPVSDVYREAVNYYGKKEYDKALPLFKQTAEQNNVDAQNYLGVIYLCGLGVVKDNQKAVEWYRKAAEQGNVEVKARLERLSGLFSRFF
jgi:tetratricopeptide (TPR) repeat protein